MSLTPKSTVGTYTLNAGESLIIDETDGVFAVIVYNKSGADCTVTGNKTLNNGGTPLNSNAQIVADTETWSQVATRDGAPLDGITITCGVANGLEVVVQ